MESTEEAQKYFDKSFENILIALEEYDSKLTKIDKEFSCGTSGFRYDENELDRVAFRIGIISCIKSQILGGLPVGIMVTASHNKYTDNGFKIAGEGGRMISPYWEGIYTKLVNAKNLSYTLKNIIEELVNSNVSVSKNFDKDIHAIVLLACDTRRSSPKLVGIITDCLNILNANFKNYGIQTTPALHFLTLLNQITFNTKSHKSFDFVHSEEYWKFLKNGLRTFNLFYEKIYYKNIERNEPNKYEGEFTIDCSNGIAAYHYKKIIEIFGETAKIHSYNTNYSEITALNESCGAEYVHKEKKIPINYFKDAYVKNVSYDGDVDRIVYFFNDGTKIKLIEGDHLNALFAKTVDFLIKKLSPNLQKQFLSEISLGVVGTAYSNGAFLNYIKNTLGLKLSMSKTGIKHLSEEGKKFDISTYFESNGHGTLAYNETIKGKIEKLSSLIESSSDAQTLELLSIYVSMFNQTVGDSLTDLICIESSLKLLNMTTEELYYIYNELEYVNIKTVVKDKNIFITTEDETRLVHPLEVQSFIDKTIEKFPNCNARCFVRPSGTEDILRIYAEAETEKVAVEIADIVKKYLSENY